MRTVTFHVLVEVQVPEDATHFHGDPTERLDGTDQLAIMFYKNQNLGSKGFDNWYVWSTSRGAWTFVSNTRPGYIEELPNTGEQNEQS